GGDQSHIKDQMGSKGIMTFYPTVEEFKNFSRYIAYIESQGAHKAGLAKIVPPKEWKPRSSYDNIDDLVIPAPIQQFVTGQSGLFTQYNIQKKALTVKEFRKLANSDKFCSPHYDDFDELERKYWKNVTFNPPIYGADVNGSLYDPDIKEWNICHLNTILDTVEHESGITIEGVNTPYLYFGMWKTTFAWHTEDMDLYSINYLHFGEPKSWYCIPPEHGKRFERLAQGFFPGSSQICEAFLRHKMTLISPSILKKYGIPFDKITQEAGEFMITFPYAYHAGFNHGFNCAESTNFATERWIEYGKQAVLCSCRKDMVKISMDVFVKKFQPERYENWLAGQDVVPINHARPTPEAKEFLKESWNDAPSKGSVADGCAADGERKRWPQGGGPASTLRQNPRSGHLRSDPARERTPLGHGWAGVDGHDGSARSEHGRRQPALPQDAESQRRSAGAKLHAGEAAAAAAAGAAHAASGAQLRQRAPAPAAPQQTQRCCSARAPADHVSGPSFLDITRSTVMMVCRCFDSILQFVPHPHISETLPLLVDTHLDVEPEQEEKEEWAKPLTWLWQCRPFNPQAEREYNKSMGQQAPYCSICVLFRTHQSQCVTLVNHPGGRQWSKPLIPEMCFNTQTSKMTEGGEGQLSNPHLAEDGTSRLVSCRQCSVRVHASCYGVSGGEEELDNWLCARCEANAITEVSSNRALLCFVCEHRWVHVLCAITVLEARFVNVMERAPVDLSAIPLPRFRLKCVYCRKRMKRLKGCCVQCSHGRCSTAFHPSCAQAAGVLMHPDDWPFNVFRNKASMRDLAVGQRVICKHKNGRYYNSEVQELSPTTFYEVVFDDGSYSDNLFPEDIENRDCVRLGPPAKGDIVQVRWTDGLIYGAKFVTSHIIPMYLVEFEDGSQISVKREDIYSLDESLPKRVKSRMSVASDMRFELFAEDDVKQTSKRQRVINSRYREDYIEPVIYRAIME
uniref:[histone H3]-trimethyl-L-lysine(9) demethylase n=1 Tax=Takifugu rubripes TaxID=31033 RepID=A0A674P901_TAKRU